MTGYADAELGGTFAYAGVATAYEHRAPYPDEVFDVLTGLITEAPSDVLDLGAGDGALARPLAARVDRVDALDISAAMVEAGRRRPGGDRPNLRWIVGAAETAELEGPYALVTAGASLHWMRWATTMRRLAGVLAPRGQLAVVEHGPRDVPWQEELVAVIRRHSRSPAYDPGFDVVEALSDRGVFEPAGGVETAPVAFRQPVGDYVEQFHSTASLAREHMPAAESAEFGRSEPKRFCAPTYRRGPPTWCVCAQSRPLRSRGDQARDRQRLRHAPRRRRLAHRARAASDLRPVDHAGRAPRS